MNADFLDRLQNVLDEAMERRPRERASFLDEACGGDADLRAEADSLLGHQPVVGAFLETPAYSLVDGSLVQSQARVGELKAGDELGDCRVISLLGEGGMGEVYLAEDAALERRVAVKLLKRRLNEMDLARRFRHERKVLAGLTHPNIARLYGGGTTSDGRSYLVMEYVEGERLDRFCEARGLSVNERLGLFRKVCSAVAYAHQNLVVHRDLKPANIRVTPEGEPKLLDFGIAKLLDPDGTADSDQTVTMHGPMTPEYASPEQIKAEPITMASDVYSLGVVLYELLCGRRPYQAKNRRPDELARAICEEEAPRPSTVIRRTASATDTATAPAGQAPATRQRSAAWRRQLEGDLDNIAAKALCKEPARRYANVAALSEDIRRHIEGLPVTARQDTLSYRTGKFVRRNKVGVAAGVLVFLALVMGLVVATWQAHVARQERDRARFAQKQSERLNNFLQTLLTSADPSHMGKDVKVVQVLDAASQTLDRELAAEPALRAEAHLTLSDTYAHLLLGKPAEEHARAALVILHRLHPPDDPIIAQAELKLTQALLKQNRYVEMEPLLRHIVMVQRRQSPPDIPALGISLGQLGSCLTFLGRLSEASPTLDEALSVLRKSGREMTAAYATVVGQAGNLAYLQRDFGQAAAYFQQALDLSRKLDPNSANHVTLENNLPLTLFRLGRLPEAQALAQQLEKDCQNNLGQGNQLYALFLTTSSLLDFVRGDYPTVIRKEREGLAALAALNYPPHGPGIVHSRILLGLALTRTGHAEEGEPMLRLESGETNLDNSYFDRTFGNRETALGECLLAERRYVEAGPLLLTGYGELEKRLGTQDLMTLQAGRRLRDLYTAWNKPAEASRFDQDAMAQTAPGP
jgi:tetratricopeptide (TPR) repeat protein/tRNA A-37 threonylcarbamoyl transferase component Bud32